MSEPCIQWKNKLAMTRIDQLSPVELQALRLHMQVCRECFVLYTEYLVIDDYLQRSLAGEQCRSIASKSVGGPRRVTRQPFRLWPLWPQPGLRIPVVVGIIGAILVIILTSAAAPLSLRQTLDEPQPGATWVHTVSWSPDGKYIAVLWDTNTMEVLDAGTDEKIFSQNVGRGYGLAWSPDGQFLASVGIENDTIQLWNVSTHQCETNTFQHCLIYTLHTAKVETIAWSPDGNFIASASDDGTVQIWNAHTMKQLFLYQDPGSKVTAITWSPDGRRVVSGDENGHVRAWDALTGAHLVSYKGHREGAAITSVSWSSDGRYIASSSYDNTARIWNVTTAVSEFVSSSGPIFAAIWAPNGSTYLALACYDGSVKIWNTMHRQGEEIVAAYPDSNSKKQFNGPFTISWSPQGNLLIAGGRGDILAFKHED